MASQHWFDDVYSCLSFRTFDWLRLLLAEAVEKLLKNPFSAEIGEHCQIAEFLSY